MGVKTIWELCLFQVAPFVSFQGLQMGIFVFLDRKRLEPKELLRQHHWGCHCVSFVMHIYDAKFQGHCFNISRDVVYSVFYHFQLQTIWHHHWSNLHNRKTSISLKRKKIFQKEEGLSNKQKIFFMSYALKHLYISHTVLLQIFVSNQGWAYLQEHLFTAP